MPQQWFNIDTTQIHVTLESHQGSPGLGTYRVELITRWAPNKDDGSLAKAKVLFTGTLEVSFGGVRYPVSPLQLGSLFELPDNAPGSGSWVSVWLVADIPATQLERIEAARDGGPITLHTLLLGMAFRTTEPGPPIPFRADLSYDLSASDWITQLERWQYAKGFMVQVPTFGSATSPKLAAATATLQRALDEAQEGDYESAVGLCRNALEQAYGRDDSGEHDELGYRVSSLEAAGKDARFWLVRRGLRAVTHLAKHGDTPVQWERSDALAAITILTSLLQQNPPEG